MVKVLPRDQLLLSCSITHTHTHRRWGRGKGEKERGETIEFIFPSNILNLLIIFILKSLYLSQYVNHLESII